MLILKLVSCLFVYKLTVNEVVFRNEVSFQYSLIAWSAQPYLYRVQKTAASQLRYRFLLLEFTSLTEGIFNLEMRLQLASTDSDLANQNIKNIST